MAVVHSRERSTAARGYLAGPLNFLNSRTDKLSGALIVNNSNGQFAALDRSIADLAKQTKLDTRIYVRMRELLRENGLAYGYSEEDALEQATLELTGASAK